MAKTILAKGDYVSAKKWSGEQFLGIYEYTYDDGSHLVRDVKLMRDFNVHKGNIKHATEEEEKQIKQLFKGNKTILEQNIDSEEEENELEETLVSTE